MSVEDVIAASRSRIEALLAPVNGGVGEDVSYDEDFERMKAEVDKLQAIDGGKIDYQVLRDYGREILETRSKDFRVALYYAAAIGHTGGLLGVLDGLVLLQELTNAFWEPMFPSLKRPRARGNLVAWYSDALAPALEGIQPNDRDLCFALEQASTALDADLQGKLGEAYGFMRALKEQIRQVVARAPAPPPPPAPPAPDPSPHAVESGPATQPPTSFAGAIPTSGGGGPSPNDITDATSAYEVLRTQSDLYFKAAEVMLTANPADADGFRFSRYGAWIHLTGAAALEEASAPPPGSLESLQAQRNAGSWADLATNADVVTTQSPLWLDGIRFLVTALENLGEEYATARAVVLAETVALLARIPGLAEHAFPDGTPVADEETRAWIANLGTSAGGGGAGGATATPIDRAAREARNLADADQLASGVALLGRAVREASTEALRFRGRLEIARLCFDFGANEVAVSELDVLERAVERHHLSGWEPTLAAQVYALSYQTLRRLVDAGQADLDVSRRMNLAFDRLTELDAAEALRLSTS